MRSQAIEAVGREGLALRVDFVWRDDRYGQVILAVDADGAVVPLLESIEGSKIDSYPVSPPFQSLSIESLQDGRRAALLVGMAGRSHWSGSIEPVKDEPAMVFDIACRVIEFGPVLVSEYLIAAGNQENASYDLSGPGKMLRIGKHRLAVAVHDYTSITFLPEPVPKRVAFLPSRNARIAAGKPVRWKYELRLLAS